LEVTDETQAKAAVEQAAKQFGRIDVAVNNAGYAVMDNFEELPTADVEQQFATNFWGVAYVMRAVLPVMRKQRSGHIINIRSVQILVKPKPKQRS
jgi:NAD(P)-dependent dehydrogenase (short-subunit alcohol dehydrogenase family)